MGNSTICYADEIIDICHEMKVLLSANGTFDSYMLKLLGRLQRLSLIIGLDEREDASLGDAFKATYEKGQWVTTENNHKLYISENGEPTKGNPHVLEAIKSSIDRDEVRKKNPRKGSMVCEDKVTFKNPNSIGKDKDGHVVTHFNHDENTMKVTVQVDVKDKQGRKFKICKGKIEHLTIFAADGVGRGVDVANELADKAGGPASGWKHSKGIGTVVDKSGKQYKADLHWFENTETGQCCWKIKEFLENMKETDKYW